MIGIGDFDRVDRRKVKTREDQILFNGKKYRRDPSTGYYVCTTGSRKRLHVAIWEHANGREVPPGYVIHHKDFNKNNNSIDNLACITVAEHEAIHHPPVRAIDKTEQV